MGKGQSISMYKGGRNDSWETPPEWREFVINTFGVNVDTCSTHENALCERHFTEEDDCLTYDWPNEEDDVCFMNPPFSNAKKYIQFAVWQAKRRNVKLVLLYKSNMETKVWQEHIFPYCKAVFVPNKRVAFREQHQRTFAPPFTAVFVLFNIKITPKVYAGMMQHGHILIPHPEMITFDDKE